MQYLVDTDWVIDHMHGQREVVSRLEELAPFGDLDILIGATALRHDLTLLTNNR